MATLQLTALWVNLMGTGQAVSGQSAPGRTETYTVPGEFRTYSGGRRRSITAAGEAGKYTFTLRTVSRTTVETLRGWAGQTVQVRDNKGRRFFGTYYSIDVVEYRADALWDVGISLATVSADEGV
jgi:hypothetical protein